MKTRLLKQIIPTLACLAVAFPAAATPVFVGETFAVTFDQPVAGHADLTGSLSVLVTGLTATTAALSVSVANTTPPSEPSARLTGFGWNSTPSATGGTETSSVYSLFVNSNFPAFSTIDVCLSSGPSCAGGGSGGLSPQQSDSFTMALSYLTTVGLDFSTFAAKFQTDFGSFEVAGTPTPVPEPGTLALLGVGLLGMASLRRRMR